MLFGQYPFEGNNESEILKKIINKDYIFPNNISISKAGVNLINGLLDKNINSRIDVTDDLFEVWYNEE